MDAVHVDDDLINVLFTEKQIQDRLAEMAATIRRTTTARTCSLSASSAVR